MLLSKRDQLKLKQKEKEVLTTKQESLVKGEKQVWRPGRKPANKLP